MPAKKKAAPKPKAAPAAKAKATDAVWVTNVETGMTHLVPAAMAADLLGQRDPLAPTKELYVHGKAPGSKVESQEWDGPAPSEVTQADHGVADDAVASQAEAMAQRGGGEDLGASEGVMVVPGTEEPFVPNPLAVAKPKKGSK